MSDSWLVQHPVFLIWLAGVLAYGGWFLVRDLGQGLTDAGRAERQQELECAREYAKPLDMNRRIMVALMVLTALVWPLDLIARVVGSTRGRWRS